MRRSPLRGKKLTSRTAAETRAMREYREAHPVCEACRQEPTQACHHIVGEKAGGPAEDWNFLALCLYCHIPGVHQMGWKTFSRHYPHLEAKMVAARIKCGKSLK